MYCFEQILEPASFQTAPYFPSQKPYKYDEQDMEGAACKSSYLLSFFFRWGTRPNEWGTHWDSNTFLQICLSSLLTITQHEASIAGESKGELTRDILQCSLGHGPIMKNKNLHFLSLSWHWCCLEDLPGLMQCGDGWRDG